MPDIDATVSGKVPPNVVSAVFADDDQTGQAVEALRNLGVSDDAITVIRRHDGAATQTAAESVGHAEGSDHPAVAALDGAGVGAAVGAMFGLVSAAIPGAGPFITAGALAHILGGAAGAAASGAIVGGTSGALAGVIAGLGVSDGDSRYYASEVERGGVYLGVDVARTGVDRDTVRSLMDQYQQRRAA